MKLKTTGFTLFMILMAVSLSGCWYEYSGQFDDLQADLPGYEKYYQLSVEDDDYPFRTSRTANRASWEISIEIGIDPIRHDAPEIKEFTVSPIRLTNLETGQVIETQSTGDHNSGDYASVNYRPEIPLGSYRIEFNGRACFSDGCSKFSQIGRIDISMRTHFQSWTNFM